MLDYSLKDLGAAIKELRVARKMPNGKKMTQAELGSAAHYGGGAGVTISRIESGVLEPSPKQLKAIANALDVKLADLEAKASEKAVESGRATGARGLSPEERLAEIDKVNECRRLAASAVESFELTREAANEGFLLRLREVTTRIGGIEPVSESGVSGIELLEDEGPRAEAGFQIKFTTLGLSKALVDSRSSGEKSSLDEFMQNVGNLTAASAVKILPGAGAAAVSGFSAAITKPLAGRASAALGVAAVLGIAVAALGATLASSAMRSRRRQEELAAKIGEIEAQFESTQPGIDALLDVLPPAAQLLDYISVHGSHAFTRWEQALGSGALRWEELDSQVQERYRQFEKIAAAQIAVSNLNIQELYASKDEELERALRQVRALLEEAQHIVVEYV